MSERTTAKRKLLHLTLLSTVIFASLPASLTLDMRVRGIPVLNAFLLATALTVAWNYVGDYHRSYFLVAFYATAAVCITGVTLLYLESPEFDIRAAVQDLFVYSGLPIGVALGQVEGKAGFHGLLRRCYFAVTAAFGICLVLLLGGYIENTGSGERQLDNAMYTSCFIIAMSFPCLWAKARLDRPLEKLLALSGLVLTLVFAVISATRSTFVTVVIALVCTAIVEIKRDLRNLLFLGVGTLLLVVLAISGYIPVLSHFEDTQLASRLGDTDYANENRFEELTMMLDQMGTPEWIHGAGFGSAFPSPLVDTGFATVPHIGITTILYKGGAPALLVLLVLPCLMSIGRLVMVRDPASDPFLAGVAIYFVQASLSGGWTFLCLLLLGAFLQLGLTKGEIQTRSRCIHQATPNRLAGNSPI